MFKKRHGWKYNKIAHSSEFNPEWYLKTYPDIAQSGVDPVRHYLRVGWCEGRNPGPNFNTNDYLAANPDVASIGMCPLLHWERFGRAECRPLTPPITPPEALTFTTDSEHLTLPTNKFDLFIPVGASCFATMHLRTMGLQKMSYPFDWSASEDDEHHDRGLFVRIGLLCNRFTDFLNASDMLDKNYPDRPEHRYVLNTRTGLHYVHDFPVSKTMAEEMPAFQEKYARRTSRLLSDIDAANNIALIWIQDVYEQIHSNIKYLPDEYWLEMYNKFASAYPGKNVSLFVFEHNPNAHDNEIQQTIIENRVFRFKSNHSILDENGWLESYKRFRVKNISAVLFQLKKQ